MFRGRMRRAFGRVRRRILYVLWGGRARVKVGNLAAKFNCSGIGEFGRIIIFDGEKEYFGRVLAQIKPGDTVWDIGANIGTHATFLGIAVGSTGHVYGFEPEPNMLAQATQNADLNGLNNVEFLPVALSDKDGVGDLNVDMSPGSGKHRFGQLKGSATIEVTVARGDSIIQAGRVAPPDVIKIDVEGHEFAVISGLAETLTASGCRLVASEVHPAALVDQGTTADLFELALSEYGFEIQRIATRGHEYHIICTR